MSTEELDKAVEFLVKNVNDRNLPRQELKDAVMRVEEAALKGIPTPTIITLARKVVFTNGYSQIFRRRLLFSLIPEGDKFPLQVIPQAISSITIKDVSVAWKYAVLSWLEGMLEYGIIMSTEPLVHITYTTIFNLAGSLSLCTLACRILYHITVREDVTPNRVQTLMRLRLKPGFCVPVLYLLRLYNLFRPDMVAGRLGEKGVLVRLSPALKTRLLEARQRMQSVTTTTTTTGDDRVWRDGVSVEKVNVYQRNTPVPIPQFNIYTETLEEKKEKLIYVTQYRRFQDMLRGMSEYKVWVWPTNTSSHLACPLLVPLFRPHQVEVQVSLTNWLEVALRTEVVESVGSPSKERQEALLKAAYDLCFTHCAALPVITNFLLELMVKWNQEDHFELVIRLLEFVGFTSVSSMSECFLPLLTKLLHNASLITWCRVIEAVTNTVCRWVLLAAQIKNTDPFVPDSMPDGYQWPLQPDQWNSPLVGVWFITDKIKLFFSSAILNYDHHPLVIHHILDYYEKVDQYCDELKVSLLLFPPPIMTLSIILSHDIAAIHRLGAILVRMPDRLESLGMMEEEGLEADILEGNILKSHDLKESVFLYMNGVLHGKAFSTSWKQKLDPFYSHKFLEEALKEEGERDEREMEERERERERVASLSNSLSFLSLTALLESREGKWSDEKAKKVTGQVLQHLREAGLTGIEECIEAYQ